MADIKNEIADITLDVDVIQGKNLVAKDKNAITRKKSSDVRSIQNIQHSESIILQYFSNESCLTIWDLEAIRYGTL